MQTEIQVTKIELRKISLEFERVAGRLLETKWKQGISNLKRFMTFIENNKVINKFIQEHNKYYFEKIICDSDGLGIVPDDSKSHEISYVYQLLKEELEESEGWKDDRKEAGYASLASAFGKHSNMQTKVDNFNKDIVLPFVDYIRDYLTNLQLNMDDDEQTKIVISNTYLDQSNSSIGIGNNSDVINTEKVAGTINEAPQ